jgi:uncharacterized membrane protein YhfC
VSTVSFIIQLILLLVLPIALGFWFKRWWGLSWNLFFGGALALMLSLVITSIISVPLEVGLLVSSITQMGALYLIYRFQLGADTARHAFMAGAGQGGAELILVGLFAVLSFTQMLPLRNATEDKLIDLVAKTDNVAEEEVEPARVDELREIIDDYWNAPWYEPLLQSLQLVAFLPIQVALAVIVLGALIDNNLRALISAIILHFLSRLVPIYGGALLGLIAWVGLSLGFGAVALWYLKRLWPTVREQT